MIREKINTFHLEDIKNGIHPSVFFEHENYNLFILRLPQLENDKVTIFSKAFIIEDNSYYYYDKTTSKFADLKDMQGFYKFLDKYIDTTLKLISNRFEEIEAIEDVFYEGKSIKDFNQQWFSYKNDLVRIHRLLFKAVEVISDLIENYQSQKEYLERNFEDIQEHLQRGYRNSGLLLEKLDALHNFYVTQNNEQMNKTIYILTILSAIFLPLNLIVGFFGMNTTSLPFTVDIGGTYKVLVLLGTASVIAIFVTLVLKNKYK